MLCCADFPGSLLHSWNSGSTSTYEISCAMGSPLAILTCDSYPATSSTSIYCEPQRQAEAAVWSVPAQLAHSGNVTFGKSAEPGLLKNTEIGDEMLAKAGVPVKKRRERPRERASDRLLATRPAEHVNMSSIAPTNPAGSCIAPEPPQSTATLVDFDPLSTLEAIHSCL